MEGAALNDTRAQIAKMLVESGARWPSIQKPGMSPTPWAAQVRLKFNGHDAEEFSLRFSDGQRWDYGQHPEASNEVVDEKTLIGSFDPDATLTGIMWKVPLSDYDVTNETVPLEVLQALGTPDSQDRDITGAGNVYLWEWPTVKAFFTTVDSKVSLQLP
ncbi:MAG: hypothetical protein R3C19_19610 [Planctomycetaceae bacterium]